MNETPIPSTGRKKSASDRDYFAALEELSSREFDTTDALAHDARNLITALNLYCDLLNEPGVLATPFSHYGNELRMIAAAGRCLVSKLAAQGERYASRVGNPSGRVPSPLAEAVRRQPNYSRFDDEFSVTPIANLAAELLASRNLLAALAGPGIAVTVDVDGGARGIRLTAEDLTRILVNLVRNSSEAMSARSAGPGSTTAGGRIQISLTENCPAGPASSACLPACLRLVVEDNGPGIPAGLIERIFDRGFTTHSTSQGSENWLVLHRGLGLAITRSIIEAASGRIQVANRPGGGARFTIELPAL